MILDLEDGVAAVHKSAARRAVAEAAGRISPDRVVVRINPAGTADHLADLDLLDGLPFGLIMLAKTQSRDDLARLPRLNVITLCETSRGILGGGEGDRHRAQLRRADVGRRRPRG